MHTFIHARHKDLYTETHPPIDTQMPSTGVHTLVNTQKCTQSPLLPKYPLNASHMGSSQMLPASCTSVKYLLPH